MATQTRFSDKLYINWLKDTLSLIYFKAGIEKIVNNEATQFHNGLTQTIQGMFGAAPQFCTSCTPQDVIKDFKRRRWRMACRLCDSWMTQIVQNHNNYCVNTKTMPNVSWKNANPKQWPVKPWEILKCYMGYGCDQIKSAEDADTQAILTTFNNCQHFRRCGRIGKLPLVDKLLKIRNSLFHSGDLLVDDTKLGDDIQTMLDFLAGLSSLSVDESQAVQEAIDKITELQKNKVDLSIYPDMELQAINGKLAALDREQKRVAQKLKTATVCRSDLAGIKRKSNTTEAGVKKLRQEQTVVTKQLSSTTDKVNINEDEVASLRRELDELSTVRDQFNKFLQENGIAEDDLSKLSTRIDEHDTRQQTLEEELEGQSKRMNYLETTSTQHHRDISDFGQKHQRLETASTQHHRDISDLGQKHQRLETASTQHHRDISDLDQKHQRLETASSQHHRDISDLDQKHQRLETASSQHHRDISDLGQKHQRLETASSQPKRDINILDQKHQQLELGVQQNHDELLSSIENLREQITQKQFNIEDLRTTLLDLYKERLPCIPIYLIKPELKHPVEEFYVKQRLRCIDIRGKFEGSDNQNDDGVDIDQVTDILFKDEEICKDVYISSEAGFGKTSLCAHLVKLWCDAHLKEDLTSNDPTLAKDLQSMKKFDLLFFI